jgi:hypothetical protein
VYGTNINDDDAYPDVYRCPEVMLHLPWSYSADIWNVGAMVSDPFPRKNRFVRLSFTDLAVDPVLTDIVRVHPLPNAISVSNEVNSQLALRDIITRVCWDATAVPAAMGSQLIKIRD